MATARTAASWRKFGKLVLTGVLVLSLFIATLASASPSLHHWMHGDHQAPSHYCLVTVLEHGQSDTASVLVVVPLPAPQFPVTALPSESFFVSHDLKLFPERGPPVLS
jgi:hypothetical protein